MPGRPGGKPKAGLDRHYGWACATDPVRSDVWYVSASPSAFKAHSGGEAQAYIFRSMGGGPWQKLGGGLHQPLDYMPYALLADHGETWQRLPFNLKSIHRMLIML
jgi:hypothetical protein